jgi:hypothetical protein
MLFDDLGHAVELCHGFPAAPENACRAVLSGAPTRANAGHGVAQSVNMQIAGRLHGGIAARSPAICDDGRASLQRPSAQVDGFALYSMRNFLRTCRQLAKPTPLLPLRGPDDQRQVSRNAARGTSTLTRARGS